MFGNKRPRYRFETVMKRDGRITCYVWDTQVPFSSDEIVHSLHGATHTEYFEWARERMNFLDDDNYSTEYKLEK